MVAFKGFERLSRDTGLNNGHDDNKIRTLRNKGKTKRKAIHKKTFIYVKKIKSETKEKNKREKLNLDVFT